MPDQQPTSAPPPPPPPGSSGAAGSGGGSAYGNDMSLRMPHHHHHQQQQQRYTPEGALRGIAADDHSLQETWQSYMNKVTYLTSLTSMAGYQVMKTKC